MNYLDPMFLIKTFGYIGFFVIVFAESGLLIGFLFPGDSLLFTAGFLASQGVVGLDMIIVIGLVAAILGDSAGYSFGYRFGPKIFKKDDSLLLNKKNIDYAQSFYEKYGGKTLIIARFMPIVRTLAPILAGVGKMKYRSFLIYNVVGGFLWVVGLSLIGFGLGNAIPNIDRYIIPVAIGIILLSISPGLIHFLRDKELRRKIWDIIFKRK